MTRPKEVAAALPKCPECDSQRMEVTVNKISLSALRRLHEAATPGPWVDMDAPHTGYDGFFYGDGETILGRTLRIEDCIPEIRNALSALLAIAEAARALGDIPVDCEEADALRAALDRVEE